MSWFFKLMICLVLLCTFAQIGHTQPMLIDDDDELAQFDNSLVNNLAAGRYGNFPYDFNMPHALRHRLQQQISHLNKQQQNPDGIDLTKRIIMLPRVGRRSVRSAANVKN